MSQSYVLHPEDADELAGLRQVLKQRRQHLGLKIIDVAARGGRHPEFVSMLERGVSPSPRMASLQVWAGLLDARVEFELDGFWDVEHDDTEMLWLDGMRQPWGKDAEYRLWLVAALRAWRIAKGIHMDIIAQGVGMHRNGAYRWEWESTDPLMARAMTTARLMDTRLRLRLVHKEDFAVES